MTDTYGCDFICIIVLHTIIQNIQKVNREKALEKYNQQDYNSTGLTGNESIPYKLRSISRKAQKEREKKHEKV